MGASAFARLKAYARTPGQDFDLTVMRYGGERLLYRLSQCPQAENLRTVFADVCRQEVEDDGVVFDPGPIDVVDIREGQAYRGKRLTWLRRPTPDA
jgi:hypothetical protein